MKRYRSERLDRYSSLSAQVRRKKVWPAVYAEPRSEGNAVELLRGDLQPIQYAGLYYYTTMQSQYIVQLFCKETTVSLAFVFFLAGNYQRRLSSMKCGMSPLSYLLLAEKLFTLSYHIASV